ncbi:MAG: ArsR family transcriptional regulator [Nitrososphaera sp.]
MTGFSNGALEYHAKYLEGVKALNVERRQGAARYYPAGFRKAEMRATGYLRNKSTRRIILYIMKHQPCIFADIVAGSGRARSTVSAHLNRLKRDGIVAIEYGEVNRYSLADRKLVFGLVSSYGL